MSAGLCSIPSLLFAQDFFQLLRPGLDILRPGKPAKGAKGPGLQHFTADTFREEFGIEPHQVNQACTNSKLKRPARFPISVAPHSALLSCGLWERASMPVTGALCV